MKIIANENISGSVIKQLRAHGHDVLSVKETMRSATDAKVLDVAQLEERIVLTHDKDFGELAFRRKLSAACGILLFRLTGNQPEEDIKRVVSVIESRTDWAGLFAVIHGDRIRIRSLPAI